MADDEIPETELVQVARRISQLRRKRDAMLAPVIFADPEWDILLDLFAEGGFGRTVSISSLCIAAAVPTTTAVRCINAMIDAGVLLKSRDPADARRVLVALTDDMRLKIRAWLIQVLRTPLGR